MTPTITTVARPTIAVVVTSFDPARLDYFSASVQSILDQTDVPDRIHVHFSSTRNFKAHKAFLDEHGVSHAQTTKDQSALIARYASLDEIDTDYVQFVDDDDCLRRNTIAEVRAALATRPDAVFFGIKSTEEPETEVEPKRLGTVRYVRNPITQLGSLPTSMVLRCVKREVYDKHVPSVADVHLSFAEDFVDSVSLFRDINEAVFIDTNFYLYRQHEKQVTTGRTSKMIREKLEDLKSAIRLVSEMDLSPDVSRTYVMNFAITNLLNFFVKRYSEDLNARQHAELVELYEMTEGLPPLEGDQLCHSLTSVAKNHAMYLSEPLVTEQEPLKYEPEVTIIVPLHNKRDYIVECVESCLKQTVPELIKVLVIDDRSTDDSLAVVTEAFRDEPRVEIIQNERNMRLGPTRNVGVKRCTTKYCYFLDADDYLDRCAIETSLATAKVERADVVAGNFGSAVNTNMPSTVPLHVEDGRIRLLQHMLEHKFIMSACSKLYDVDFLRSNDIQFSALDHEDTSFIFEAVYRATKVANQPRSVYLVRPVQGSISRLLLPSKIHDYLVQYDIMWKVIENDPQLSMLYPSWRLGLRVLADKLITRMQLFCPDLETLLACREQMLKELDERGIAASSLKYFKHPAMRLEGEELEEWFQGILAGRAEKDREMLVDRLVKSTRGDAGSRSIYIVADVNYHVEYGINLARALRKTGYSATIIDRSAIAAGGKRAHNHDYHGVKHRAWEKDWYEDVIDETAAVVYFNTHGEGSALEIGIFQRAGVHTFSVVEGITDFLNEDTFRYSRPYLNTDTILVPGVQDKRALDPYHDRVIRAGNSRIREQVESRFPRRLTVLLNLNFTYGVLESKARRWINEVREVCNELGVDIIATRHPMDKSTHWHDLPIKTTSKTFYDALRDAQVCISRFGTALLEAQAEGLATIYYDTAGETVSRFKDMPTEGSIRRVTSKEALREALVEQQAEWAKTLAEQDEKSDYLVRSIRHGDALDSGARVANIIAATLSEVRHQASPDEPEDVEPLHFDGSSEKVVEIDIPLGRITQINMTMEPASTDLEREAYKDSYPPMPLREMSGMLYAFHEESNLLRFAQRSEPQGKVYLRTGRDGRWHVHAFLVPETKKLVLASGGRKLGEFDISEMSDKFTLKMGRGFIDRYWAGSIGLTVERH